MSSLQLVVMIVAMVAGALANAKQSGEVPSSLVPYVTFGGAFLAGFGVSLGQAGALTLATLVAAAFAGVQAAIAAGGGVAMHFHFSLKRKPSNDNGSKPQAAPKAA